MNRDYKQLAQSHRFNKCVSQDSNPGTVFLTTLMFYFSWQALSKDLLKEWMQKIHYSVKEPKEIKVSDHYMAFQNDRTPYSSLPL